MFFSEKRAEFSRRPTTEGAPVHKWRKGVWRGFDTIYLDSGKFADFMRADNEGNGAALKPLGLSKWVESRLNELSYTNSHLMPPVHPLFISFAHECRRRACKQEKALLQRDAGVCARVHSIFLHIDISRFARLSIASTCKS